MAADYDAVLIVAFGGPEGPDDVLPFLANVLKGRKAPMERIREVAAHYDRFGGKSPLNEQVRSLIRALVNELNTHGPKLPVYWGNRNWHPLLADTVRQMAEDGVRQALALFLSPYSSYSSCRQYLENIEEARAEIGHNAPQIDRIRAFYNHPGFIAAMVDRVAAAIARLPAEHQTSAPLVFTAHSIPAAMAQGCRYEAQLGEACRLVATELGRPDWRLVYQSRSGPPSQPWLGPDVCDHLRHAATHEGVRSVVLAPIGFLSDHIEVLYDLDIEAKAVADELGLTMVRAGTVGTHPSVINMFRLLIAERTTDSPQRLYLGGDGPAHDVCPPDCCPATLTGSVSES
jgi:ferrochelatase